MTRMMERLRVIETGERLVIMMVMVIMRMMLAVRSTTNSLLREPDWTVSRLVRSTCLPEEEEVW